MNRSWKVSIIAVIYALSLNGFSAYASIDDDQKDDSKKSENSSVLATLDKMIAEIKTSPKTNKASTNEPIIESLELSLRNPEENQDDGFLYLRDKSPIATLTSKNSSERPGFSSLLSPNSSLRGSTPNIFDGSSRIGLSFGNNDDLDHKGLELAIESAYSLSGLNPNISGHINDANNPFTDRSYNVGLSVGYSGFNLNASVIREQSLWNGGTEGFGFGFSYTGTRWAAQLSLSEYKEGIDLQGINNEVRNFVSVELGASYQLSNSLGILGGIRYFDQRNSYLNKSDFGSARAFFLGGRLKF